MEGQLAGGARPGTADEADRLAELHEYGVLDAPADEELETVVRLVAAATGVPTATLNILDAEWQRQLTTVGFEGGVSPRSQSMCAVRFREGRTVNVADAREHPDYAGNAWVTGEAGAVRLYASAPLVTPRGHALGTLCVFDGAPRALTPEQLSLLEDAAAVVVALFERRRQSRENARLAQESARRHEALREAYRELERSNTELEQFAAVASHDLRSPLAVVQGYLELLEETCGDRLDGCGRDWLGVARRCVQRMAALTETLLITSHVGAATERRSTDLREVAGDAVADLRVEVEAAGAAVEIDPGLPTVYCEPTLVRQLLQNLLANAVKYRRRDRPCRVRVDAEPYPGGWQVSVIDNGEGIPRERREQVFVMYARDEATAGRAGHGVGLATCKRIVERHGGTIRIDDAPGGGAAVRFTLPQRAPRP